MCRRFGNATSTGHYVTARARARVTARKARVTARAGARAISICTKLRVTVGTTDNPLVSQG